jgi:formate dehydrogenase iron-sulfur subunit
VEALRRRGRHRAAPPRTPGGAGATNGIESLHSFFLLMDHPNVYNLPEAPRLPSRNIVPGLLASLATATVLIGALARALGGRGIP